MPPGIIIFFCLVLLILLACQVNCYFGWARLLFLCSVICTASAFNSFQRYMFQRFQVQGTTQDRNSTAIQNTKLTPEQQPLHCGCRLSASSSTSSFHSVYAAMLLMPSQPASPGLCIGGLWRFHGWGLDDGGIRAKRARPKAPSAAAHSRHAATLGHLAVALLYLLGLSSHVVQSFFFLCLEREDETRLRPNQ